MPGLDREVTEACRAVAGQFAPNADAATRDDLLEGFSHTLDAYNTIVAAEAWKVHQPWAEAHRDDYDPVVWQRLDRVHSLSLEATQTAEVTRAALRLLWTKFFLIYDFLVLPATPCAALTKTECTLANRSRLLSLTAPASLGGLPVLTVPVVLPSGLSTGLQIVVNHPQSPAVSFALGRAEKNASGVTA
jgi:amidase/aspartyl-tRNA(Asn)/glutamyl-tRNA(Gln) amidotransferase subunit A